MLRSWDQGRGVVKQYLKYLDYLSLYLDFKEEIIELVVYVGKIKNKKQLDQEFIREKGFLVLR